MNPFSLKTVQSDLTEHIDECKYLLKMLLLNLHFPGDPLYVGFDLTIASFDSISEVSMVSISYYDGCI